MISSGHHFVDPQGDNRRWLIATDGRVKLLLLLAGLAVNLAAGGVRTPLLLAGLAVLLLRVAGVPLRAYLLRMLVPALMALTAFLSQLVWYAEGAELYRVSFWFWEVAIHAGAVSRGAELAVRILGGMSLLLCFALSTPLPELMRAARFFRCPAVIVELALIMYRYIFLLLEEGQRIRAAQRARLGFVDLRSSLCSTGILGGMLLLRSFDRAERSFEAMRCRGYRGALTVVVPRSLQAHDWTVLGVGLVILGGLWGWS